MAGHPDRSAPAYDADDLRAIQQLVQRAHDAQGDAEALVALHTDGAVIVNLAGRRVLGAAAFAEAMRAALDSPLREVRTTVQITDVRPLGADSVLVSCVKSVHDERADTGRGEQLPARGALSYVLVKVDDAWRIAFAQTTPMIA